MFFQTFTLPLDAVEKIERHLVYQVRIHHSAHGVPAYVDVTIAIDSNVQLYDDTIGFLERPLLGSGATINFAAVRFNEDAAALAVGETIQGALAAPDFLAQAGYGQEQATQVQNILARADDLSDRVNTMVADFTDRSEVWFDRVDSITTEIEDASRDVNSGVDEARELLARFDQVVAENQPVIAEAINNFESAGDQLNSILTTFEDETLIVLNDMFEQGRDGVAEARVSLERIDTLLVEQTPEVRKTLANARLAYVAYEETVANSARFAKLREQGAQVQRPLWASTSTKDPDLSDVLYVETLIGPDTVNTVPPATYEAFKDHGVAKVRIHDELDEARVAFATLAELGVDFSSIANDLEEEGVFKFAQSFESLLTSIVTKREQIQAS